MAVIKKIIITFFAIIFFFTFLIAMTDWNWIRGIAVRNASEALGRTLIIENLQIDWSWAPRIHLDQVRLENASWSNQSNMFDWRL